MDFNSIPLVTAFIGTVIAAIWDFKTTEVPDQLSFVMIAIALLFYGYQSFIMSSWIPIGNSLLFGIGFLLFGGVMYYIGQWGGADSLILGSMGFLLPSAPVGAAQTFLTFPLSFVINLFIVGAIYMLLYGFVFSLKNKNIFSNLVKDMKAGSKSLLIGGVVLFIFSFVIGLNITKIFYGAVDFTQTLRISLYPLLAGGILYLVWIFAKSVESYGFRKKIPVSKLKVGDMLLSEKKLVGVTQEQIKSLKKSGKRYVEIKIGVPFAVAFPLALLVTLYVGDLIFVFASWI